MTAEERYESLRHCK